MFRAWLQKAKKNARNCLSAADQSSDWVSEYLFKNVFYDELIFLNGVLKKQSVKTWDSELLEKPDLVVM